VNSTSDPVDPMPADEKLGTAAEYLASQIVGKKADGVLPAFRAMVHMAVPARVRGVVRRRASAGGATTEDEQ